MWIWGPLELFPTKGSGLTGKTCYPREYGEKSRRLTDTGGKGGKKILIVYIYFKHLSGVRD